jgi:hypothetical protein
MTITDGTYIGRDLRSDQDYEGCNNEPETSADDGQRHCEPTHSGDGCRAAGGGAAETGEQGDSRKASHLCL